MQDAQNPTVLTPLPKQPLKTISNSKNKSNTANFLLSDWIMRHEQRWLPGCEVHLAGGFHDIAQAVKVVPGHHSAIPKFEAGHKEADSGMFLHVAHSQQTLSKQAANVELGFRC